MRYGEVTCQVMSHVVTSTQNHKCTRATHTSEDGQTPPCPIKGYYPFLRRQSNDSVGRKSLQIHSTEWKRRPYQKMSEEAIDYPPSTAKGYNQREPSFLGEARKKRKIEELEEELKLLKGKYENENEQHRRRRSSSHSDSCEGSHRVPGRKDRGGKSEHRHQRAVPPKRRRHNHAKTSPPQHEHNPIWRKLQQISLSPFSAKIDRAKFPPKFVSPSLPVYDGKSDPVGHLSRYRQAMALHNNNDALMCRLFPSSLGEVGLRWFDRLEHGSIRSWQEISQIFTARFITNTRKPKEIDSLLALMMKAGETLKAYSTQYWEVYNDIDACDEDIVVKTFRFGLHQDCKLRKSFTKRPPVNMADLMTRLEQHIRVEDDPKSTVKLAEAAPLIDAKAAQPESRWAKKSKSSTNPPGTAYKYHLEHLVKNGYLKQYVDESKNPHQTETPRTTVKASTPVGIIDVIHYGTTSNDQRGEMRRTAHLREVFQIRDLAQMAPAPSKKESSKQIVFNDQDLEGVQLPHSDALVVTLRVGEFDVKRILIDPSSSVEIMYESLFRGLGLGEKDLSRPEGPLSGFSGETVVPTGKVTIDVTAGTTMAAPDGRGSLHTPPTTEVPDTAGRHGSNGGPSLRQNNVWWPQLSKEPNNLKNRSKAPRGVNSNYRMRQGCEERRPQEKCAEELVLVSIAEGEAQRKFLIGNSLSEEHKSQLLALLKEYQDVFAWTPYEAPGVDSEFICHELNVSPKYKSVAQKARRTAPQHAEAMREEVDHLLKIGGVREVLYPQWLSNTVVVKKKNGKWRVCVDSTDLNKACPKDPFLLPKIDQLVMPFGLKNAGATYQRMVTKMFSELLGKTIEVYIDDMVVKSVRSTDHVQDLRQVFRILRTHNLKLNASKCAFGVSSGKFLGFMVTQHGIETNPDQIAAIQGLQPPKNVREVRRLTGMAAALNRFISKSAEKCRPFFDLIKKGKNFVWSEESNRAFEQLKKYLSEPALLSSPKDGEPLYVYLAASEKAVSVAIIRNDSGEQRPVYYTSKTMNGAETRYLPLEKSALTLFITAKKLPHYFQAHTMIILTSLPLKALFRSSDFSGQISKWGALLGAYDVRYKPRTAIKGQVLADFIAEFAPENNNQSTREERPKDIEQNLEKKGWALYVDGAANSRGSGLGIVLISPEGELLEQAVRLGFSASNNEAEYEILLHGLRAARLLGADPLTIHCDSQLIVNQLTGEYMAKDERMVAYLDLARNRLKGFHEFNIERVGREHNRHADSLAGLASSVAPDLRRTIAVEVQDFPSISKNSKTSICQIEIGPNWMDPILDYLLKDVLPADQKEAAKVRKTATRTGPEPALRSSRGGVRCPHWRRLTSPQSNQSRLLVAIYAEGCGLICQALLGRTSTPSNGEQAMVDRGDRLFHKVGRGGTPRTHYGLRIKKWTIQREYCSGFRNQKSLLQSGLPARQRDRQSPPIKQSSTESKKRLEEAKGRWVEELPTILWTFRTTPRNSTGETPFSLTYGVEAVIPLEVGLHTLRSEEYDQENNELIMAKDLDLAQERRDLAMIRLASYQGDLKRRYGKNGGIKTLAMLGVSPVKPQVVWRNGIKTLATSRCFACESSSGVAKRHQNPSHARCPAPKPSSGTAERH
uniref:RNase H type-1 domain-containing protein n=1 Tax=Fagus sylvatica TaxID=28930 RepID=A0A2N9IK88_FAGSY